MKTKIILLAASLLFMLTACNKESDLTPSDNFSIVRFTFPQGNNSWDADIKAIYDEYNVYLIYKDVTPQDLNRQWTSLGTGKLWYGNDLTDEQVAFYVNFMKNHVFSYISPEIAKLALPVKIYMLDNLRSRDPGEEDSDDSGTGTGGTGTGTGTGTGGTGTGTGTGGTGTGGGTGPSAITLKTDGFDYWAISFTQNEIDYPNDYTYKIKREVFLSKMIITAVLKGIITEPTDFKDGIDYKKAFYNDMDIISGKATTEDPNYYMNRGFIKKVSKDFTHEDSPWSIDIYNTAGWESPEDVFPYMDYVTYIRAAMYYTREEFMTNYPPSRYSLIERRYNSVVNHLKNTYGIDLEGIAKGPQQN